MMQMYGRQQSRVDILQDIQPPEMKKAALTASIVAQPDF